jgi:1,4-dihydroxy-2-naphthoate octaprenyltransferase
VVNNLRDREQDRKAGKKTLAVRWGELFAVWEYSLLLVFALLIPIGLVLANQMKWPGLLVLLLVPWAVYLIYSVQRVRGKKLNSVLAQTALLMFFNGVLISVGLL